LRNISEGDLQLAKQSLKGRISRNNLSTAKRLEERTKSLYYLGQTNEDLTRQIEAVSLATVQEAVSNSLKTPLTVVSRGG
jgi:predicted Zn-dependent peptidase